MSQKAKKTFGNIAVTVAFPLVMLLIMELVNLTKGTHIITSALDLKNLIRQTGISCIVAYALSFNLTCGRMDLSLGAQRLVGVIIGGNIALSIGLSGAWLVIFAFIFGILFGIVTGLVFVWTRVPAMVLGIGVGLVYECIAFSGSQGKGLNLFGVSGVEILTNEWFIISTIVICAAIVLVLLSYTAYGYHLRAIQGSQRIAKSSGVNIFANAVVCYALAGGMVGVAGTLDAAMNSRLDPSLGFTSNGTVMANMFPMFLGMYLARWSNQPIGILVASLTLKIFALGLARLELNDAATSVVTMALFLLFLIFLANENVFKVKRAQRARIAEAHAEKERRAQSAVAA